jgi:two-component system LytT family response regulator
MSLRILIVDDDAGARTRLRAMLAQEPDCAVVGEAADGRAAVALIREREADVVFLDVEMPYLSGFQVVQHVGAGALPFLIFCSAYEKYAVQAFEAYALDYLLKPFDAPRLQAALARARARLGAPTDTTGTRLDALLAHIERLQVQPASYPPSLAVLNGPRYDIVRVADITRIEADGNYAVLHTEKAQRVVTKSLLRLEEDVLDPAMFVRVHRSTIVNIAHVVSATPEEHGDLVLHLAGGRAVRCSRRYRDRLDERLHFLS